MGISFEQIRDSYSMVKSGCKFYDGMTEIHPEDIVKRLDRLSKLEQTPALSIVMGSIEPKLEQIEKVWTEYCQRVESIEGTGSRLRALKNMNPNDIRSIISMLKKVIGENVR